ncbi:MAG: GGDEF domain-containing protein [Gammaproteobacteria bacterium]|nr:GGDEF domain-containing protein [Gammaproteobacteria bacterium]
MNSNINIVKLDIDHPVSSLQLQQQELVRSLYDRVTVGILITLFIWTVVSIVAYIELSIQGRQDWVSYWYTVFCVVLFLRYLLLKQFRALPTRNYFPHTRWHNWFFIGVAITGLMQGLGSAWLIYHVTPNVQIILHAVLLGMGMGAIAYLSTSRIIYTCYLLSILLPTTMLLFWQQTSDGYVITLLYSFTIFAGSMSVKRMNILLNDALYYRFDNETLVEDMQRLLDAVSKSNKALEKISTTDELTGIASYRAFRVRLEEVWQEYRDTNTPISLVRINVDHYYEYNDHYGPKLGDQNLCKIAGLLLAEITHHSQMVARLNGAEFAMLLPGMSCENARLMVLRIQKALADLKIEHIKSKSSPFLTISAGLSCLAVTAIYSSRELLSRSEAALKAAKHKGRNRLEIKDD